MMKEIIPINEITNFQSRSEEFFPVQWFKYMLENKPVYYHETTDTWNVFKYEHVKQVLSNYEYFSSEGTRTTIFVGDTQHNIMDKDSPINITSVDPPRHRKSRSLLSAAFTPRNLKIWESRIQQIAKDLIDTIQMDEPTNLVEALAGPLPSFVIADLVGVPLQDRYQFKNWVDILFKPYDKTRLAEIAAEKEKAAREYFHYLYPIVIQKRTNLSDDIVSDLIRAEVDGERFSDEEIVQVTMMLLGAGVETTSHGIANTFYSLLYDSPSLYTELRNNPELVPNAVEEMLRYRFHTPKRDRTVKKDNDLLGVPLKKGDIVIAWMSASNLDGDMFENPFTLDIHRPNNKKHLTFGSGPHFCLGAPLARLEMKIALETFLQKFSMIEPIDNFDLEQNLTESATGQSLTSLPAKVYR